MQIANGQQDHNSMEIFLGKILHLSLHKQTRPPTNFSRIRRGLNDFMNENERTEKAYDALIIQIPFFDVTKSIC